VTKVAHMARPILSRRQGEEIDPGALSHSPHRSFLVWTAILLGFGVALMLDRTVYVHFFIQDSDIQDWYRLLRVGGYLPYWLLLALAWMLMDRDAIRAEGVRRALSRGFFLCASVVSSGIIAEALKLLIRRERPGLHAGDYFFRPWREGPLDSTGLGLPSSHAAVAFAATWALCHLYPRATPVWLMVGLGCGVSRLLDRAHFLSDVYLAAVFSFLCVRLYWHWLSGELPRCQDTGHAAP
jgi:membrane-associated phospholipid phosphatase